MGRTPNSAYSNYIIPEEPPVIEEDPRLVQLGQFQGKVLSPEENQDINNSITSIGQQVVSQPSVIPNIPTTQDPTAMAAGGNTASDIPKQPTLEQLSVGQKMQSMLDDMEKNIKGFKNPLKIDPLQAGKDATDEFLRRNKDYRGMISPEMYKQAFDIGQHVVTETQSMKANALSMFHQAAAMAQQEDMKKIQNETKTPNEIELQIRANKGDKEAAQNLADIRKAKIDIQKASGEGRANAYGNIRAITVIDTKNPDPDSRLMTLNMNQFNELNSKEPGRYVASSQSPEQKEAMAQAVQRGGATTSNVVSAVKMYKMEAPELIDLREKVRDKGLLPESGFKDIGALNQWLGSKTNDPDTALLQKKTKFLADSLMRVIGGSQGGEWAFKVASDILDPSYSPEAFSGIVNSHGEAMIRMAKARASFGKSGIPDSMEDKNTPSKYNPADVVKTGRQGNRRVILLKNGSMIYE